MALSNLVDTYFKPEYEEYYNTLGDTDTLDATLRSTNDTINTLSSQFSSTLLLLQDLQGEFTGELYESISGLTSEMESAYALINYGLAPAIDGMKTLGADLIRLKSEDDDYQKTKNEYNTKQQSDDRLADKDSDIYKSWYSDISGIKVILEDLISSCQTLQEFCDENIEIIDLFNNNIVDLRLKLVSFIIAQGGTSLEDIQNWSLIEKEEYLQNLLDKLKTEYNDAKDTYQSLIDALFDCGSDFNIYSSFLKRLFKFYSVYAEEEHQEGYDMMLKLTDDFGASEEWNDQSYIKYGQFLTEFIEWYNTTEFDIDGEMKTVKSMMDDYIYGDKSFIESGLVKLYRRNSCQDTRMNPYASDEEYYEDFMDVYFNYNNYTEDELRELLKSGYQEMLNASEVFNEKYPEQLRKGLMYKSVASLKNELPFDEIRQNDKSYKNYAYSKDDFDIPLYENPYDEWEAPDGRVYYELTDEQFKVIDYVEHSILSENEKKMVGYLFSTGRYEEAANYVDVIKNGVNKRTGDIEAEKIYNGWLRGENEGLDLIVDNFRSFSKGLFDGGYDYFNSFKNVVDPDIVPTEKDYEIMRMRELISQPVYKIDGNYYGKHQIDGVMASQGYIPCGSSPSDGYIKSDGSLMQIPCGEPEIIPKDTLWDETVSATYGVGFKVVETSVDALANAIHPALGASLDLLHDFGKDRKQAEQAAYLEMADLTMGIINDGVDYGEFFSERGLDYAEGVLNVATKCGGDVGDFAKVLKKTYGVTKTIAEIPSTGEATITMFAENKDNPFQLFVGCPLKTYDKLAGLFSTLTDGEFNFTTGHYINKAKDAGLEWVKKVPDRIEDHYNKAFWDKIGGFDIKS